MATARTFSSISFLGRFCSRNAKDIISRDVHMRIKRIILEHHRKVAVLRLETAYRLPINIYFSIGDILSPAIIRRVVDFPHPDGPTKTVNSLFAISRSIP